LSNSTSGDTSSSDSGSSEEEMTLSDADAGKIDADIEEGEIISSCVAAEQR
jgi:hypothetical protein